MASQRNVRGINRVVALALAAVWLAGGVAGAVVGVANGQWLLATVALGAIGYSALWFRVAVRSQLLTWRGLAAPWRAE